MPIGMKIMKTSFEKNLFFNNRLLFAIDYLYDHPFQLVQKKDDLRSAKEFGYCFQMQSASNWGEREKIGELVGVLDVVEVVVVPNWLKSNQLWSPNWRENNQEQKKGKNTTKRKCIKGKRRKRVSKIGFTSNTSFQRQVSSCQRVVFDVKLADKSFRILGKSLVVQNNSKSGEKYI